MNILGAADQGGEPVDEDCVAGASATGDGNGDPPVPRVYIYIHIYIYVYMYIRSVSRELQRFYNNATHAHMYDFFV